MVRILVVTVIALALLVALLGAAGCSGEQVSRDDFTGIWRETGQTDAREMRITAEGDLMFVTYARFYPSHGQFSFADGRLTYSAITPDMTDVITYDADEDTITITSGSTGDSYVLSRVEE